jgi:hypothetical protein
MSSPKVRNLLTGMTLVMALMVALPGSTEAAGLRSSGEDMDVWSFVVSWFSDLWTGAFQEPAGGTSVLSSASSATTEPGTGGPSTSAICGGDQGMCIDPNG